MILKRDSHNKLMYSEPFQLAPVASALARSIEDDLTSAVNITLENATTWLTVHALDQGVYLKYGADVDDQTFDEYIQPGGTIDREVDGVTAISLIEASSGATAIVIQK